MFSNNINLPSTSRQLVPADSTHEVFIGKLSHILMLKIFKQLGSRECHSTVKRVCYRWYKIIMNESSLKAQICPEFYAILALDGDIFPNGFNLSNKIGVFFNDRISSNKKKDTLENKHFKLGPRIGVSAPYFIFMEQKRIFTELVGYKLH